MRRIIWTRDRVTVTTLLARAAPTLTLCLLAVGCSEFYVPPPDDCSEPEQAEFIYNVFEQVYLWNDKIPARESVDFASYEKAADIVKDIKYKDVDRWSYVADKVKSDALFQEGKFIGYGFNHKRDDEGRVRLSYVYPGSPAGLAGLKRGDELISINNYLIPTIDSDELWGEIWGPKEPGVSAAFDIRSTEGDEFSLTLVRDWIDIVTVPVASVLNYDGERVGYLNFSSFVGDASDDLDDAWDVFNDGNITSLIVDLRYNGGGKVSIARHLIDLIAGAHTGGDGVSYYVEYNDNLADNDEEHGLKDPSRSIDLDHVTFITTGRSISASELVINAVAAHMSTYIVGSATGGKPVGSKRYEFCDSVLWPITFRVRNADGKSDYFDGLATDCDVSDDLDHELGDKGEAMLAMALSAPRDGCTMTADGELDPGGIETPAPLQRRPGRVSAAAAAELDEDPLARILGGAQ